MGLAFGGGEYQPAVALHLSIPVALLIVAMWSSVCAFAWWVMAEDPDRDGRTAERAPRNASSVVAAVFFGSLAVGLAIVPALLIRNVAVGYRVGHMSTQSWAFTVSITVLVGSLFVAGAFASLHAAWSALRPHGEPAGPEPQG